jgi:hypothetical protein
MKTIWYGSAVLAFILFLGASPELAITPAFADDICVQLTQAEFPQSRRRRGEANDCSRQSAIDRAKNRARDNAAAALDQVCLNNITVSIAGAACTRVSRVVNTDAISPIFPMPALPPLGQTWHAVKSLGHGVAAGNANLCIVLVDLDLDIDNLDSDGSCWFDPIRTFAKARARARCGIVCTPQVLGN